MANGGGPHGPEKGKKQPAGKKGKATSPPKPAQGSTTKGKPGAGK